MPRAPFQVLVIPFLRSSPDPLRYAVLRRDLATGGYWQFVAGGGEDDESPKEAARREAHEEIGSDAGAQLVELETITMIPVAGNFEPVWGPEVTEIPEHCFGLELDSEALRLSDEHTTYRWLGYGEAGALLKWESNKVALAELHRRLSQSMSKVPSCRSGSEHDPME